jgi:GNAT superfamily N-acetyltransferase
VTLQPKPRDVADPLREYEIAPARAADVPVLPFIERAASVLLAGHAPASVLAETTSLVAFHAARREGRLLVALAAGRPVGFAHIGRREPGAAHLEEIDVHPWHGRRGLGRRLVAEVCRWAAEHQYAWVTLTTFRDLPWNAPFYARLGFTEIPDDELGPALRAVLVDEARRGLDPARRLAMRRPSSQPFGGGAEAAS